jgi:hypothetical protein
MYCSAAATVSIKSAWRMIVGMGGELRSGTAILSGGAAKDPARRD